MADTADDVDFEKELDSYIESEENSKKQAEAKAKAEEPSKPSEPDDPENRPTTPSSKMDKTREQSDNEDSEVDDYNLTEDQKRAMAELENLKNELGYTEEPPPEYDVRERLKVLNEDLKNDPTPIEKTKDSKVGFKSTLVDLVAPPPDYDDEDGGEGQASNPKNTTTVNTEPLLTSVNDEAKTDKNTDKDKDKVDDNSEPLENSKKSNTGKKDAVLIEIDGQFQLVSSDDVRARDLGYTLDADRANKEKKQNDRNNSNINSNSKLNPTPPDKPRPATAANGSRRNGRTSSAKQRPQSAQIITNASALNNHDYTSPYALSPREKQLMEERRKAIEKQKMAEDRRKREEEDAKERENRDAFEFWLKKKRETDRRKKITDEEERRKNEKEDRTDSQSSDSAENEEAFKGWLKEKNAQFKKEKLLKRRQDQEMHEGYYVRSRDECDKAYKLWLKSKARETRKARVAERQKCKLQRLAAKRARKSINLSRSIGEAQSFRYVDYYGYRF